MIGRKITPKIKFQSLFFFLQIFSILIKNSALSLCFQAVLAHTNALSLPWTGCDTMLNNKKNNSYNTEGERQPKQRETEEKYTTTMQHCFIKIQNRHTQLWIDETLSFHRMPTAAFIYKQNKK
jgi:hypothetical protein